MPLCSRIPALLPRGGIVFNEVRSGGSATAAFWLQAWLADGWTSTKDQVLWDKILTKDGVRLDILFYSDSALSFWVLMMLKMKFPHAHKRSRVYNAIRDGYQQFFCLLQWSRSEQGISFKVLFSFQNTRPIVWAHTFFLTLLRPIRALSQSINYLIWPKWRCYLGFGQILVKCFWKIWLCVNFEGKKVRTMSTIFVFWTKSNLSHGTWPLAHS